MVFVALYMLVVAVIALARYGHFIYGIEDSVKHFLVRGFFRPGFIDGSYITLFAPRSFDMGAYSRFSRKYRKTAHNAQGTTQDNSKGFLFQFAHSNLSYLFFL